MSDAQLPPVDPNEVEQDDDTTPPQTSTDSDSADRPAIVGVGPALVAPPESPPSPEPLDDDATDDHGDRGRD